MHTAPLMTVAPVAPAEKEIPAPAPGFFQAVRLLERMHPERQPVGRFADPGDEVARFSVNPRMGFPAGEIASARRAGTGPVQVKVNFMGLTGASGVLPHEYSLLVLERLRAKDGATAAFFDLFHHRILSLFYRAWEKHRFTVGCEKGEDRLRDHILDLSGAGVEELRPRLPLPDDAMAYYAGLLALRRPTAASLEQLVEDLFRVPAEVQQFVGEWHALSSADQCALGEEDEISSQLGLGAVVGDEVWDQQARVRVRLGPLTRKQFDRFLPTGDRHDSLRALVRYFTRDEFGIDVQLVLARDEVPGCVLGDDSPQSLGWSTWIRSAAFTRDADETTLAL
jgi:type VI secretion system protein ImpH